MHWHHSHALLHWSASRPSPAICVLAASLLIALTGMACDCAAHTRAIAQDSQQRMRDIRRPDNQAVGRIFFPTRVAAGGRLQGSVPPDSQVLYQGQSLPVDAAGRVDWPLPPDAQTLPLRIIRPDGRVLIQRVRVLSQPD